MKKYLFGIFTISLLIAFTGCSKDDEVSSYSTYQEKAFAVFNGTWADIQFSNLQGGDIGSLFPDPEKIVFGTHYKTPIEVSENDFMHGDLFKYEKQGECVYHSMPYKDQEYEIINCYYYLTTDADKLYLYKSVDNKLYKSFNLTIQSDIKMRLHDTSLTLPYIFIKQ